MRFAPAFLACLLLAAPASAGAAPSTRPEPDKRPASPSALPAIGVALVQAPPIRDSLVRLTLAEAEAIWAPFGVTFEWHHAASEADGSAWPVLVTIDDRTLPAPAWRTAFGWITFEGPETPGRSIHLSLSSTEALLLQNPVSYGEPTRGTELRLGRALGRALAHEIGHYLLRSKVHTPRGLMRAVRSVYDFTFIAPMDFGLTVDERETVARNLQQGGFGPRADRP